METTKEQGALAERMATVASASLREMLNGLTKHNHEKLADANADFLLRADLQLQFWGQFGLNITYHEAPGLGTCGVNATASGFNLYWDRAFVEKLDQAELYFLLLHEFYHLILSHPGRMKAIQADHAVANLAGDAIINGTIINHIPIAKPIEGCVKMPPEYKGEWVFEQVYEWMKKVQDELPPEEQPGEGQDSDPKEGEGQSEGEGEGEQKPGNGKSNGKGKEGKEKSKGNSPADGKSQEMKDLEEALRQAKNGGTGETLDKHIPDTVAEETKAAMAERIIQDLKNRGLGTADIDSILDKLKKSKKDYIREIKRSMAAIKGTEKEKTFARANRRGAFGIKGIKKVANELTINLDVSGSMSGDFEVALGCVLQDGIRMNLIQCDTEVKKHDVVKSMAELQKLRISGGGGTMLQPGVNYACEKLNNGTNMVVLTDGICDSLDFSNFKGKVLILTTRQEVEIIGGADKVKQIVIERD